MAIEVYINSLIERISVLVAALLNCRQVKDNPSEIDIIVRRALEENLRIARNAAQKEKEEIRHP